MFRTVPTLVPHSRHSKANSGEFEATGICTPLRLTMLLGALFMLGMGTVVRAGVPAGDYGDAPETLGLTFPTSFATPNSRVGQPGVHHLTTSLEMLGTTVSAEVGTADPADPDGVPNLPPPIPPLSGADGADDGVTAVLLIPTGAPFGTPMVSPTLFMTFTVDAAAPDVPRFLNILLDVNRDGAWRDTATSREWVVVNQPVDTAPGVTESMQIPLDVSLVAPGFPGGPTGAEWMRVTLSRTEIDENATAATGGWDGSGAFAFGETEDYDFTLIPIGPTPDCSFRLICNQRVVFVDHIDPDFPVSVTLFTTGAVGGAIAAFQKPPILINDLGPITGLGILNGLDDAVITGTTGGGGVCPGNPIFTATVDPFPHPPPASFIQSFAIVFRIAVNAPGFGRVFSGSKTCHVAINHRAPEWLIHSLPFGQLDGVAANAVDTPITVGPVTVVFGNDQPTSGTITVMQGIGTPPGGVKNVLPLTTLVDISFDEPEVLTEITGLYLGGYTNKMVSDAGFFESELTPLRVPMQGAYIDIADAATSNVGASFSVDEVTNMIKIQNPNGVGLFLMRGTPRIPSVSEWGLLVTAFLILAAGTVVLRRRVRRRSAA